MGLSELVSYDLALKMKLAQVPGRTFKRVVAVSVHKVPVLGQNLGMVHNAFIPFINFVRKVDITRFDLSEDYSTRTSMVSDERCR